MEASALNRSLPLPRSRRLLAALSDERLAKEAKRGNEAAFEVIYDRYHRQLLAFCRHMLGSREDAEDTLQQTFASAFRALPGNDQPAHLKSWLYTIARNRSLSILRARREHPTDEVEQPSFDGLSEQVERRAELKQILADLEHLPERQRSALVLAEVSDLNHTQIADVLECEAKQVKSLVFQARSALAQDREARAIPCAEIREEIASARGRDLRRSHLRRHIRSCSGCAEFEREARRQRELLAIALPVLPSVGLKRAVLSAAGIGGGGAAGGGAAGGGGLIAAIGANGAAKVAAVAAVAGGAVGGVAATDPGLVKAARSGVERAVAGLGQAVSGELDRKIAAEQEAQERRAAAHAAHAEKTKGGPATLAAKGVSANRGRGSTASENGSTPRARGRGATGGRPGASQRTSPGRSQAARGAGRPRGASPGARSRRPAQGSRPSAGSGPRRLSPGRVVRSAPRVARGARRVLRNHVPSPRARGLGRPHRRLP